MRQRSVRADIHPDQTVYDLMAGMGECLPGIAARADAARAGIRGVDFSPEMCIRARATAGRLRPGGRFSFVEISEPRNRILRWTYLPYLRYVVPVIGWIFLGNLDNYRRLGVYTRRFGDCARAREAFAAEGLAVEAYSLFFGCATGIAGEKR